MAWIKNSRGNTVKDIFLHNMNVESLDVVNSWFEKSRNNRYFIKDLRKAADIVTNFKNDKVTIIGDYDVDGQEGTSILYITLMAAGFKNVKCRIPYRFSEGYGLKPNIIDEIDGGLVLTVDNGIASIEAIDLAKKKGLTVVILDHHLSVEDKSGKAIFPDADCIVDPSAIPGSDFSGYCGAGLAFRFAKELLDPIKDKVILDKLNVLAAIATVCDCMDLKEENYVIVRNGLKKMKYEQCCTSGLYALLQVYGINKTVNESDLGFKVGPSLNAPSRLYDKGAQLSVNQMVFEGSHSKAMQMAQKLYDINADRKNQKKDGLMKAFEIISSDSLQNDCPLIVYVPGVGEGVIGILASNIVEKYKVPVIVFSDSKDPDVIKGSGRSYGDFHMKKALDYSSDFLEINGKKVYGGHKGAAGMSLLKVNLSKFRNKMKEFYELNYDDNQNKDDFVYDIEISANEVPKYLAEVEKYGPWGMGNEPPVFKVTEFQALPVDGQFIKLLGSDESIVKISGKNADAIGFDMGEKFEDWRSLKHMNLIGTLSSNFFNDKKTPQIEFSDYTTIEVKKIKTDFQKNLELLAIS